MARLSTLFTLTVTLFAVACSAADPNADGTDPTGGDDLKGDVWGSSTSTKTLVLRGTVITMDEARGSKQVITNGAVVIKGQKITAILDSTQPLPTGSNVVVLPSATGASDYVITPGLINSHNHLAYDTAHIYEDLPLYQNTYQWRDEAYYDQHIMLPKRLLSDCSADVDEFGIPPDAGDRRVEMAGLIGRYAEAKELASGTTTTQGSYFGSTMHNGYAQHLVRNLDATNFGKKRVSQVALGILVNSFDPREVVAKMDAGSLDAWLVHLLEGTDAQSSAEFDCLRAMGLVRKQTAIIHGIALTHDQLAEMAHVGAKLIASPLDNLLYYGKTADLPTAWQLGVNVSLGTDWSPAGSKNLLMELKVVDALNKQAWGNFFSSRDLLQMVTTNPADAIGWTNYVGRLEVGLYADVAVYRKRGSSTYRSVIDATEKDVRLVLIGGDPLYGDADVMATLKPTDSETVATSCGFSKAIDLTSTLPKVEHGDVELAQVRDTLGDALAFDFDWIYAHYDPARTGGLTKTQVKTLLAQKYPYAMTPRTLDPMYTCEDGDLLTELRTDANIRTAYGGVCLDLRGAYGVSTASPDCGAMPAHPTVVTVAQHPGTVPERPAAWCAAQNWSGSTLPKP